MKCILCHQEQIGKQKGYSTVFELILQFGFEEQLASADSNNGGFSDKAFIQNPIP